MSDRDASAIATWERMPQSDHRDYGSPRPTYACASCCWHSKDWMQALEHHVQTAHQIEIEHMSHWGPVTFPQPYVNRMRARLEKRDAR